MIDLRFLGASLLITLIFIWIVSCAIRDLRRRVIALERRLDKPKVYDDMDFHSHA
jgi:hypothetical protein